jgi:hypothetical protein
MCGPGKGIEAGAIHDGPPGCGRYSRFTVRKVTVRKRAQRYREKWPLLLSDIGIVAGGPVPDAGGARRHHCLLPALDLLRFVCPPGRKSPQGLTNVR